MPRPLLRLTAQAKAPSAGYWMLNARVTVSLAKNLAKKAVLLAEAGLSIQSTAQSASWPGGRYSER